MHAIGKKHFLNLAIIGCTALGTGQAVAQSTASAQPEDQTQSQRKMQQEINDLQQQIQNLRQQQTATSGETANNSSANNGSDNSSNHSSNNGDQSGANSQSKSSLTLGGGVATEYQYKDSKSTTQPSGGDWILDYFALSAKGKTDNGISYAAEERFSTTNFKDSNYLHYGWAAYSFGKNDRNQIKGGLFQVPFGNLKYGYQTFWGNLDYYAGFTDHQAAGIGYRLQTGAWRFDADLFKNDNLGQRSTYSGGTPSDGYRNSNGVNLRAAYTLSGQDGHKVTFSAAGKGGQLQTGNGKLGSRWAGTVAMNGQWDPWIGQLQVVDYGYNVPANGSQDTAGTVPLPQDAITAENYGFNYRMPARGQIYSANLARNIGINWGPFHQLQLYDNYGYLRVGGDGRYNSAAPGANPSSTGDAQLNAAGAKFVAGPIYIWADLLSGRNAAMAFVGPNDGHWHTRVNITAAFYFSKTMSE